MAWIDRAARRAAASDAPDRLIGLVERRDLTRRQALKGFAAGAVLAGPASGLLTPDARAASCLRSDAVCVEAAEATFSSALSGCARTAKPGGGLWGELRCRVRAQSALTTARQACRQPDHSRCPEGAHCDGSTGACVAGDPPPAVDPPPAAVGSGPCAGDWPTEDSLLAARDALSGGAEVVNLSPGGCIRLERTLAGGNVAAERMTVAGAVISETAYTATGRTGRRDADGDGFFERTFASSGTAAEFVTRDPVTKAVVRRERRTVVGDTVEVVIEAGEASESFVGGLEVLAAGAGFGRVPDGEYCGAELDKRYGTFLMRGLGRAAKCLEEKGRGDLALELMDAGTHSTILCGHIGSDLAAVAADAMTQRGGGRIIIDTEAVGRMDAIPLMELLMHEVLHYTSLGLHNTALLSGDGLKYKEDADPIHACAALCIQLPNQISKCQCATCLETKECDERCAKYTECEQPDMGAICPCKFRNKWYPTFEECAADCAKGLLCFGFSKCKGLSRKCDAAP